MILSYNTQISLNSFQKLFHCTETISLFCLILNQLRPNNEKIESCLVSVMFINFIFSMVICRVVFAVLFFAAEKFGFSSFFFALFLCSVLKLNLVLFTLTDKYLFQKMMTYQSLTLTKYCASL